LVPGLQLVFKRFCHHSKKLHGKMSIFKLWIIQKMFLLPLYVKIVFEIVVNAVFSLLYTEIFKGRQSLETLRDIWIRML
jgi:hypothetical protein